MGTTRRNLLKFAGGSAVGLLFTPAPWRLITDTALWSQNWPGIPKPVRGEANVKYANCSLCPAGCAVKAQCIGSQPISLTGVAGHPLSHGALCPFGLAGHHLPYHPQRLATGPVEEAAAAVEQKLAAHAAGQHVAVLDLRPGRTASWTYRRAMAAVGGLYISGPQPLGGAAANLAAVKTVLSFGAPVLEGWGTPGNVLAHRPSFRLVQVEAAESRTAALADTWLRIAPGSENALALGLANALLNGAPAPRVPEEFAKRAAAYTTANAAAETGLSETQVAELAKEVTASGPTLVVAGSYSPDIHALNLLTGAWGTAVMAKREAPVPDSWKPAAGVTELASVPDRSLSTLLIDESEAEAYVPWSAIERKLVPGAVVVTFSSSRAGYARHVRFALPVAVYPEIAGDIPPAVDCPAAAFRLSTPMVKAPAGMVDPSQFIAKAAGIGAQNALRERADAIHKSGRGEIYTAADGKITPVKNLQADDFWKGLQEGGCWMDPSEKASEPPTPSWSSPPGGAPGSNLPLAVAFVEGGVAPGPGSPILSKLYRESGLFLVKNHGMLHPETASACGMPEGGRANLKGAYGSREIRVTVDEAVPRGVLQIALGAEVLDVCGAQGRAKVTRI